MCTQLRSTQQTTWLESTAPSTLSTEQSQGAKLAATWASSKATSAAVSSVGDETRCARLMPNTPVPPRVLVSTTGSRYSSASDRPSASTSTRSRAPVLRNSSSVRFAMATRSLTARLLGLCRYSAKPALNTLRSSRYCTSLFEQQAGGGAISASNQPSHRRVTGSSIARWPVQATCRSPPRTSIPAKGRWSLMTSAEATLRDSCGMLASIPSSPSLMLVSSVSPSSPFSWASMTEVRRPLRAFRITCSPHRNLTRKVFTCSCARTGASWYRALHAGSGKRTSTQAPAARSSIAISSVPASCRQGKLRWVMASWKRKASEVFAIRRQASSATSRKDTPPTVIALNRPPLSSTSNPAMRKASVGICRLAIRSRRAALTFAVAQRLRPAGVSMTCTPASASAGASLSQVAGQQAWQSTANIILAATKYTIRSRTRTNRPSQERQKRDLRCPLRALEGTKVSLGALGRLEGLEAAHVVPRADAGRGGHPRRAQALDDRPGPGREDELQGVLVFGFETLHSGRPRIVSLPQYYGTVDGSKPLRSVEFEYQAGTKNRNREGVLEIILPHGRYKGRKPLLQRKWEFCEAGDLAAAQRILARLHKCPRTSLPTAAESGAWSRFGKAQLRSSKAAVRAQQLTCLPEGNACLSQPRPSLSAGAPLALLPLLTMSAVIILWYPHIKQIQSNVRGWKVHQHDRHVPSWHVLPCIWHRGGSLQVLRLRDHRPRPGLQLHRRHPNAKLRGLRWQQVLAMPPRHLPQRRRPVPRVRRELQNVPDRRGALPDLPGWPCARERDLPHALHGAQGLRGHQPGLLRRRLGALCAVLRGMPALHLRRVLRCLQRQRHQHRPDCRRPVHTEVRESGRGPVLPERRPGVLRRPLHLGLQVREREELRGLFGPERRLRRLSAARSAGCRGGVRRLRGGLRGLRGSVRVGRWGVAVAVGPSGRGRDCRHRNRRAGGHGGRGGRPGVLFHNALQEVFAAEVRFGYLGWADGFVLGGFAGEGATSDAAQGGRQEPSILRLAVCITPNRASARTLGRDENASFVLAKAWSAPHWGWGLSVHGVAFACDLCAKGQQSWRAFASKSPLRVVARIYTLDGARLPKNATPTTSVCECAEYGFVGPQPESAPPGHLRRKGRPCP
uniref:Uncharacterized protein n=1 Tax=Spironucleus barkhanus TaxID=103874 RepID=A1XZZ5_SPIBA|nr:hypothetical protein [Spironucleus barkhanus]